MAAAVATGFNSYRQSATTPHHYAGASATRDRRDRDELREALADLGRRDEDEPRDVTDALDR